MGPLVLERVAECCPTVAARVGVADGPFAAHLAARSAEAADRGFRVVGPGETAAFLAPLPVTTLEAPELTDVLVRLGIRTLGALADLSAGVVIFLVALPLCLGIALASDAPLFSGVLAGMVGGIVVGLLSGSHTSVSGPAAGLTAVGIAQIAALGSFEN